VYLSKLKQRLHSDKAQQIEELLYQYAYGKPMQSSEVSAEMTLEHRFSVQWNSTKQKSKPTQSIQVAAEMTLEQLVLPSVFPTACW
jgi:hypothetical protein